MGWNGGRCSIRVAVDAVVRRVVGCSVGAVVDTTVGEAVAPAASVVVDDAAGAGVFVVVMGRTLEPHYRKPHRDPYRDPYSSSYEQYESNGQNRAPWRPPLR